MRGAVETVDESGRRRMTAPLLEVSELSVAFDTRGGPAPAVSGVSFRVEAGRALGLVGESGCGKTVTALAIMGLIDPPGRVTGGTIALDGAALGGLSEDRLCRIRGRRMAMIFQEPMTALNPVRRIGDQIAEVSLLHDKRGPRAAWNGAVALLDRVGIPEPDLRARDYPHRLSGGMRQRAMIAMALAGRPALLIADEPTTALDVTVQAQILELLDETRRAFGMAILFISHDLGAVSEIADDVAAMYAGRIVERAPADALFDAPRHPYTAGLLATLPRIGAGAERLPAIDGNVPDLAALPAGCAFRDRCPRAFAACAETLPPLAELGGGRAAACLLHA